MIANYTFLVANKSLAGETLTSFSGAELLLLRMAYYVSLTLAAVRRVTDSRDTLFFDMILHSSGP